MFRKYAEQEYYFNDMANQLKVNHLDMTFEPTWTKAPGEEAAGPRAIPATYPAAFPLAPGALMPPFPAPRRYAAAGVAPGMRAEFGEPADKRPRWAPELQLELMAQAMAAPMPSLAPAPALSAADEVSRLFAPPAQTNFDSLFAPASEPAPTLDAEPAPTLDAEPAPTPLADAMDIGILEEAPPLAPRAGLFDSILAQQPPRRRPTARKTPAPPAPDEA
jgi:hypothetical protein